MRRLQTYLDDRLDATLAKEAARRGTSKAAIIRQVVGREFAAADESLLEPWTALDGWLGDGAVDDIDAAIYDDAGACASPYRSR